MSIVLEDNDMNAYDVTHRSLRENLCTLKQFIIDVCEIDGLIGVDYATKIIKNRFNITPNTNNIRLERLYTIPYIYDIPVKHIAANKPDIDPSTRTRIIKETVARRVSTGLTSTITEEKLAEVDSNSEKMAIISPLVGELYTVMRYDVLSYTTSCMPNISRSVYDVYSGMSDRIKVSEGLAVDVQINIKDVDPVIIKLSESTSFDYDDLSELNSYLKIAMDLKPKCVII